ncbi:MAG TPA: PEP-utilizing enzyme [Dehalococcoidia bacterium]|nr:PEP-utilizing enzyme [Dehalococcoidia bacterium]
MPDWDENLNLRSFDLEFNVVWEEASHANESWVFDRLHYPRPQPPLTQHIHARFMTHGFGVPTIFVNGYSFMRDYGPPPTTQEVEARGPVDIWQRDFKPRVQAECLKLRSGDYDSVSAPELVASLEAILTEATKVYRNTTNVIFAFMRPTSVLIQFCEAESGDEGAGLAARLLQGYGNATSAAGFGLSELTELAERLPAAAAALKAGNHDLEAVEGGAEFLPRLRSYLDEFGWRAEGWNLEHIPTWAEDPSLVLDLIGRYLSDPERSPAAALRRSEAEREAAKRELELKLDPSKLSRFRELAAAAIDHVAISEERALWQLQMVGSVRVPYVALGRKLAAAGVIDVANDIFYLTWDEVLAAANDVSKRHQGDVEARKAELAAQEKLLPPTFIGVAPSMSRAPSDLAAVMRHLRGYGVEPSTDASVINGMGASRGVARGRARIIVNLSDSERLSTGDILICRTTSPPWTPLFSIAGGVVTDAGGILSHSAICAREYGIPCVVGTQVATQQVPEGAMIEIDGTKGSVTILQA